MNRQPHSDEVKAEVARLWNSGKSAREVGAIVGMTRCAIIGLVNRMGLPSRPVSRPQSVPRPARIRKAKPRPPAPDAPIAIGPIGDFVRGACAYIEGEPTGAFQTCGHPGYPYCEYHASLVRLKKVVA